MFGKLTGHFEKVPGLFHTQANINTGKQKKRALSGSLARRLMTCPGAVDSPLLSIGHIAAKAMWPLASRKEPLTLLPTW